ncbi:RloB family protein [Acinetobacter courvalinii]|uniref:RloB family protein n=1 Tax=Acinetobacter courvalinii TaxID=280147 RepID=UPI00289C106D|nr:RloB family protein [Acinetobacter courvalinii]
MTYRLSSRNPAESRTNSETENPKIKIFFVFEGAKTEPLYFEEFINIYEKKAIGEFIILDRLNPSLSNQKSLTEQIETFLNNCENLNESNINKLKETITALKSSSLTPIDLKKLRTELEAHGIPKKTLKIIFKKYPNNAMLHLTVMETIVTMNGYNKNYDKVCIIIDRDSGSFSPKQFDEVIKICSLNNFNLGISNPCFELYLYLHLNDLSNLDKLKILENKKDSRNGPTYMEKSLRTFLTQNHNSKFEKNKFDTSLFLNSFTNIPDNIISSQVKTDNLELKTNIGTSVYNMINHLINE